MRQSIKRSDWGVDGDVLIIPDDREWSAVAIGQDSEASAVDVYPECRADRPIRCSARSPIRGPVQGPLRIVPVDPVDADATSVALYRHDLAVELFEGRYEVAPIIRSDAIEHYSSAAFTETAYTLLLLVPFRGRGELAVSAHSADVNLDLKVIGVNQHGINPPLETSGAIIAQPEVVAGDDAALYQWGGLADWIAVYGKVGDAESSAIEVSVTTRD